MAQQLFLTVLRYRHIIHKRHKKSDAVLKTVSGVPAHRARNGILNVIGEAFDLIRGSVQHHLFQDGGIGTFKRGSSGEHLVHHGSQRILVGASVHGEFQPLFGRHIKTCSGSCHTFLRHNSGETEIHHFYRPILRDHDIGGGDIPVYDLLRVSFVQGGGDLPDDRKTFRPCHTVIFMLAPDPVVQIIPFHELRNEITIFVGIPFQRMTRSNIVVLKLGNRLKNSLEFFHFPRITGGHRKERESDFHFLLMIQTLIAHAHSALPQFGEDLVVFHDPVAGLDIRHAGMAAGGSGIVHRFFLIKKHKQGSLSFCCTNFLV